MDKAAQGNGVAFKMDKTVFGRIGWPQRRPDYGIIIEDDAF